MSSNRVRYLLLGIPLPRIQCSFYEQTTSIIIKYNRILILVVSVVETNPILWKFFKTMKQPLKCFYLVKVIYLHNFIIIIQKHIFDFTHSGLMNVAFTDVVKVVISPTILAPIFSMISNFTIKSIGSICYSRNQYKYSLACFIFF